MVRKPRKRSSSVVNLKRLVYLISPEKIYKNFYNDLEKVLAFNNVKFFQLRLKKSSKNNILNSKIKLKI